MTLEWRSCVRSGCHTSWYWWDAGWQTPLVQHQDGIRPGLEALYIEIGDRAYGRIFWEEVCGLGRFIDVLREDLERAVAA